MPNYGIGNSSPSIIITCRNFVNRHELRIKIGNVYVYQNFLIHVM